MQPYFVPYAGYFRLFAAADTVVMFDCVQFPRRGWVHRNRFSLETGELDWLTLPLQKAPFEARIAELRLAPDAPVRLSAAARRFPVLRAAVDSSDPLMERVLKMEGSDATQYLCDLICEVGAALQIQRPVVRSSSLDIDPALRGQERVIAIVKALGGTHYVNPPGGRALYDHTSFAQAGLELRFLTPFGGSLESILTRLLSEAPGTLAAEIRDETTLVA